MSDAALAGAGGPPAVQRAVLGVAIAGLAVGGIALAGDGWRHGALFLVGGLLGLTLYHAAFGFTAAYRRLFVARDVTGMRAQMLMLAVATVLFAPFLADGAAFGQPVAGAVAPVGVQVVAGAFLFGLGMQLGGGCGSGTLFTVGGGNARMLVTLAAFVAGSFWASLHMGWWWQAPALPPVSLGRDLGWPAAVALQLAVFLVIAEGLRRWGRPAEAAIDRTASIWRRLATGPWPLVIGAVMLALLNLATLMLAGHPWTITWAFTLWGAKAAQAVGWGPSGSVFWSGAFQARALAGGVLDDVTSVMNLGIVLGALGAAALAGRFRPSLRIPLPSLAAAVLGGLLMGYGARIAFGCNIGAFFSGVASTSLHGWVWIAAALLGSWVGVKARPRFGLAN